MAYELLLERIAEQLAKQGVSERKACLRAGLKVDAIRNIRRGAAPRLSTLTRLAKLFGVPQSLFFETVETASLLDESDAEGHASNLSDAPWGYAYIQRLAARPGMGGVGLDASDEDLVEPELLPVSLIEGELRGTPEDFILVEVDGQSMEPVLESGDRVLVDKRKISPSQGGIFVLHDGDGFAAKWVERVHRSDPPALRIFSENVRFKEYEILEEDAHLIGRVVWFARRM